MSAPATSTTATITTSAPGTTETSMNIQAGSSNQSAGQVQSNSGPGGNSSGVATGQSPQQGQQQQQSTTPSYSIPGILHYLQYEWQRFELERQQWMVEKAELQARIALLQGMCTYTSKLSILSKLYKILNR